MEALDVVMRKAVAIGTFHGIQTPQNGPIMSHLLFADDAIFVGTWSMSNIMNLSRILRCFYLASGLKVNYKKSRIFGLGVEDELINQAADNLKCQVGKFPFKYLGMPIGANMNHIKNWKDVVDIFESRLSTWKAKTLSFGGKITLLKSVLGSLPLYFFSLFKAPIHVIESLEKIRSRFLWSGTNTTRKIHWIKWATIMAPRDMGGLGIGSLRSLNLALLGKWWWRAKTERKSLWFKIISAIHHNSRSFNSIPIRSSNTGTWKNILSINKDLMNLSIDLGTSIVGKVGNGEDLLFWSDVWLGDSPLCERFPTIARLALHKDSKVADYALIQNGNITWQITLKKPPHNLEEISQWNNCMSLLNTVLFSVGKDCVEWKHNIERIFTSRSLRWLIDRNSFDQLDHLYENNKLLPIKVNFLHWRMVLNRLPLRVSLAHRGVHLDLAECPICNSGLEDKDHIFAYCPFASMVWTQVGVWLKLPIVSSSSLDNIMDTTGYGMRNGSSLQIIVDSVLKSALWCIWKTRNDRVFKNINPCPYKTVEEIKILSFLWVKNRAKFGWLEWNMWVSFNLGNNL
ncbi:hypothetical protein QVD17_21428 [Tagetes erecta]|uniref:Reverse transcriptase domain-containing protein n=1 Tax=Tagetes erecta TaxID=13708 RepID=A0AAD8KEF9_TARER|nr:hypothetical protein QVD17_21428 [Tagetes erecta]